MELTGHVDMLEVIENRRDGQAQEPTFRQPFNA
jgi:hypothetical protein